MKKSFYNTPSFRYIFEIIVIVFSVTLSFYIQDVLNDRENIELKNESLEGVLADLKEDLDGFNTAHKTLSNRIEVSEKFLSGEVSNEYINQILYTYGFLGIDSNYKSLVSMDYEMGEASGIIDGQWIKTNKNVVKIVLWYDNEWGYSSRVLDLAKKLLSL